MRTLSIYSCEQAHDYLLFVGICVNTERGQPETLLILWQTSLALIPKWCHLRLLIYSLMRPHAHIRSSLTLWSAGSKCHRPAVSGISGGPLWFALSVRGRSPTAVWEPPSVWRPDTETVCFAFRTHSHRVCAGDVSITWQESQRAWLWSPWQRDTRRDETR